MRWERVNTPEQDQAIEDVQRQVELFLKTQARAGLIPYEQRYQVEREAHRLARDLMKTYSSLWTMQTEITYREVLSSSQ